MPLSTFNKTPLFKMLSSKYSFPPLSTNNNNQKMIFVQKLTQRDKNIWQIETSVSQLQTLLWIC